MTRTLTAPRELFQFPRGADIEMFIAWNQGVNMFDPDTPARQEAMVALKRLVTRLDMHQDFHDIVVRMAGSGRKSRHGDLFGQLPPPVMLREFHRVLRMHGYINRSVTQRVPLTGMQLMLVRCVAHGKTMQQLAEYYGCDARRLRAVAVRAYEKHGCLGQTDMVGCAYRNQWLPTHKETSELFAMSRYVMSPGYLTNDKRTS